MITLPTDPAPNGATAFLQDFGGELTPFLGGPVQRINRLGTRLGLRVTMPPIRGSVARQFVSRLLRGKQEGVILEWPLLDLEPEPVNSPVIGTSSSGTALSMTGLVPGNKLYEGQPISVVANGFRYTHIVTGGVTASIFMGAANVGVFPPTRVTYPSGSVVEITTPKIEGFVSPGDELSWEMALEHTMGFSFSVLEAR